jgi:sigma-B regulation protein RsbU (phosphoserine phosphatase)
LGELAAQFNKMTVEIEQHRSHLEELVNERTEQLEKSKQDLEKTNENLKETNTELTDARRIMDLDMKMAINVQKSFFLNRAPESREWDIDFIFKPMSGVSGDMYDIYTDESGRISGISLMDVSGHGIAAGLVTMIAKTISARVFNTGYKTKKLRAIMDEINDELIRHLGNVDNFLTGIMLKFDYENQQVEYVNAGHTDLLFKPEGSSKFVVVAPPDNKQMYKGFFLGIEAMRASFSMLTFKIKAGDTLLIYSDCLNESVDESDEEFGVERIKNILEDAEANVPAKEITHRAYDSLIHHTGTDSLNDDLAIIAIKKL